MAGQRDASLNVSVNVMVPQLSLCKTVALSGFQTVDSVSNAISSLAQCCSNLRFEHGLAGFSVADGTQREHADKPCKASSNLNDVWEAALLQPQQQRSPQKGGTKPSLFSASWQDRLVNTEYELEALRTRFKRNLESMACMRATYLLEISRLKEHIFTMYGQRAVSQSKDETLPKLRLLTAEDYIIPSDLPLPLEQAVACAKARMEIEWNEYAQQLHKRIEELCEKLHQKTEQAAKQSELFDRLWSARRGRVKHNRRTSSLQPNSENMVASRFHSDHSSHSAIVNSPSQLTIAGDPSTSSSPAKFLKSVWRRTFSTHLKEVVPRSMTAPEIIGCDGSGKFSLGLPKRSPGRSPGGGESPMSPSGSGSLQSLAGETSGMFLPLPTQGSRHGSHAPTVLLGRTRSLEMRKASKTEATCQEPSSASLPASPSQRLQELRPPPIYTSSASSPPGWSGSLKSPPGLDAATDVALDDSNCEDESPASSVSIPESPRGRSMSASCQDNLRHPQQSSHQLGKSHIVVDVKCNEGGLQPPSPGREAREASAQRRGGRKVNEATYHMESS